MAGFLTTHVLDTALGLPGRGMTLRLYRHTDSDQRELLCETQTNEDGRTDQPILDRDAFLPGRYELCFEAGEYFRAQGLTLPDPAFLDTVVIRFGIADPESHYHVPLLISPFSYSTYRGS